MVTRRGRPPRNSTTVPEDLERFGSYVRKLREEKGLTQTDVAGERYSAGYLSFIESGQREPSPAVVQYLAQQLDVDPEELWACAPSSWVEDLAKELRSSAATAEARTLMERSLSILESAGRVEPRVVGIVHRELGLFAMERGEVETAEKHLREAIRYFELDSSSRKSDLVLTYFAIGRLTEQRHDLPRAVEAYRSAAALVVEQQLT